MLAEQVVRIASAKEDMLTLNSWRFLLHLQ